MNCPLGASFSTSSDVGEDGVSTWQLRRFEWLGESAQVPLAARGQGEQGCSMVACGETKCFVKGEDGMSRRYRIGIALLVVAGILGLAAPVFAGDTGSVATLDEPTSDVSLTAAPLRGLSPMLRLTGEFEAEEAWSIAVIGGFGSYTEGEDPDGELVRHEAWELGAQARYYLAGDFDNGLHLGFETLFRQAPVETIGLFSEVIEGTGRGLAIGPAVGYKIATEVGLTFDAQVGARYDGFDVLSEAEDVDDLEVPDERNIHPMINLNVGWTF